MESEGKTYLIYDKVCNGDRSFNNILTTDITIKNVFNNPIFLEGKEGLTYYNSEYTTQKIPQDLNFDIYNLNIFKINKQSIDVIVTIICIDNKLFEEYFMKHDCVSQELFIIDACTYHKKYTKHFTTNIIKNTPDKITDIVDNAIKPDNNVLDAVIDNPLFVKIKLFDYQRRTIKWMLNMEKKYDKKYYYSTSDSFGIKIGNIVYDPFKKKFISNNNKNSIRFKGGALVDEVGLGKTIESISMCLLNQPTNINYIQNNKICSKATLIICPNQLAKQWEREFKKMINDSNLNTLNIVCLLTKTHFDKLSYLDLLDTDFVIVSFNFLGNNNFLNKWIGKISSSKSYMKGKLYNYEQVNKLVIDIRNDLLKNPIKLSDKCPILPAIYWNRVIVDEIHEPYVISKYSYVKNMLPHINGKYKWCLTGTPFDKGSGCLLNMIEYVTDYENNLCDKIVNTEEIYDHLMYGFFRRNTKKSVENEYKLQDLTERIIWLKFSQTERMIYNANLANLNTDKFSVLMRQICCHPNLAEETKSSLSNCKTLKDIEKMMVLHYKKVYENAMLKVQQSEERLVKLNNKKTIIVLNRQRKFLKELDYNVTIKYSDYNLTEEEFENVVNNNDEQDEKKYKKKIEINNKNSEKINGLIAIKWNSTPFQTLLNIDEDIKNLENKIITLKKDMEGKKITYTFFVNVMDKVSNTIQKEDSDDGSDCDDDEDNDDNESDEDSDGDSDDEEEICGICMCPVESKDLGVTKCGHIFDYECLKTIVSKNNKCPMCNTKLNSNEIYLISYEKKVKNPTKEIKDKLDLINKVGTKLANLIYYINSIPDHVIIFSQWDNLLKKVGSILHNFGIKNVFCKGNVWQRGKAIREFTENDNIKVIMLSSEKAASGINLTKATKVILLDPVYGSYDFRKNTEWQAVGRAYRTGQTKKVEIVRFVIKDSVEEEIYLMNKRVDSEKQTQVKIEEINDDSITLTPTQLDNFKNSIKNIAINNI